MAAGPFCDAGGGRAASPCPRGAFSAGGLPPGAAHCCGPGWRRVAFAPRAAPGPCRRPCGDLARCRAGAAGSAGAAPPAPPAFAVPRRRTPHNARPGCLCAALPPSGRPPPACRAAARPGCRPRAMPRPRALFRPAAALPAPGPRRFHFPAARPARRGQKADCKSAQKSRTFSAKRCEIGQNPQDGFVRYRQLDENAFFPCQPVKLP